MTFRTCILVACMVIVPGLAMFSHRLPNAVRASLRQHVWIPAHDAVQAVGRLLAISPAVEPPAESPFMPAIPREKEPAMVALPAAAGSAIRQSTLVAGTSPPARVVMPTVPLAPANEIVEQATPQGNGLAVPLATARAAERGFTQPAAPRRPSAQPPQTQPAAAPPDPPIQRPVTPPPSDATPPSVAPDPPGADAAAPAAAQAIDGVHQKLVACGAVGIECHPLDNGSAGYATSCRINIDPRGELQRMFHGTGIDRPAAMQSLLEQVEGWKRQQSATPL